MKTRDELIQDYIDSLLTDDDKSRFDELYRTDADFRKDVALQEELNTVLARRLSQDELSLRVHLADAATKLQKGKVISWRQWLLPLVAAACVIITVKLVFFPNAEALYALPTMRSEVVRGHQSEAADTYEKAVDAYNAKNYAESSSILLRLHQADETILQYQFYLGLSLIGEKDFVSAQTYLLPLADGASVFQQESSYYLAVAFLQSGQDERAKERLSAIKPTSSLFKKAQKLSNKIGAQTP